MKTMMTWSWIGAAALVLVTTAASADPSCSGSEDVYCAAVGSQGVPANPLFNGVLEIGPKSQGGAPSLYVVLDGKSGDTNPLDGYLGLNTADIAKSTSVLGLIGSAEGDFARDGSNDHPITQVLGTATSLPTPGGLPAPSGGIPNLGVITPSSALGALSPLVSTSALGDGASLQLEQPIAELITPNLALFDYGKALNQLAPLLPK